MSARTQTASQRLADEAIQELQKDKENHLREAIKTHLLEIEKASAKLLDLHTEYKRLIDSPTIDRALMELGCLDYKTYKSNR